MSAETLRRAAALMRERAEDVAEESGIIRGSALSTELWFIATDDYADGGNATHAHVASWRPAVALAVANLLDREAAMCEEFLIDEDETPDALAVANAYLGEGR